MEVVDWSKHEERLKIKVKTNLGIFSKVMDHKELIR